MFSEWKGGKRSEKDRDEKKYAALCTEISETKNSAMNVKAMTALQTSAAVGLGKVLG